MAEEATKEAPVKATEQTERNPITVVASGESFEKFVDAKMPKKADEQAAAEPAKDAKAQAKEEPKPDAKPEPTAEEKANHDAKRYQRLVEGKKKAEGEAAELRRQNAELLAKLNPPEPADIGPEPVRAGFGSDDDYLAALKDWTRKDERRTAKREEEERQAKQRAEKVVADWKARQDSFAAEVPDYAEKIAAAGDNVKVSDQVRDAILESDAGPQILYYFADAENAEYVEKLGKMTVGQALKALGKLEAQLQKEPVRPGRKSEPDKPNSDAPGPEISRAPPPISALKGASVPAGLPFDANGNWTGTAAQYRAARESGKIK